MQAELDEKEIGLLKVASKCFSRDMTINSSCLMQQMLVPWEDIAPVLARLKEKGFLIDRGGLMLMTPQAIAVVRQQRHMDEWKAWWAQMGMDLGITVLGALMALGVAYLTWKFGWTG